MSADEFNPLLGPAPDLLLGARKAVSAFLQAPLSHTLKQYEKFGPLSGIVLMHDRRKAPPYVFALGPDIFPELQNPASFIAGTSRFYPPVISDPLVTALAVDNLQFIDQPDVLQHAFTPEWVARFVKQAERIAVAGVEHWERFRNGEPFDVQAPLKEIARTIALKTVFGFEPDDEPAQIALSLCDVHADSFQLVAPSAIEKLAGGNKAGKHATAVLKQLVRNAHFAADEPCLIGALAAARAPDGGALTDADLFACLAGLYPAIERGLASTMAWTCVLISQEVHVLAKIQDELFTVCKGNRLSAEDVPNLVYLGNVIRETMRLFPPKAFGSRISIDDVTLGDWVVPQDTLFVHSPYVTHRDKIVYDKPGRFLPHRFSAYMPTAAEFMPFGDLEPVSSMVIALAQLVLGSLFQRNRLTMLRGQTVNHHLGDVLAPIGPIPMYVVPDGLVYPISVVTGSIGRMVDFED